MSTDIKLSIGQFAKIIQSDWFLSNMIGILGKKTLKQLKQLRLS